MWTSNAKQVIATAGAKTTVVHVDFAPLVRSAVKHKSPVPKLAFNVSDLDDIDQIVNRLREEMSEPF
jgi:hypothetical protein